MLLYTSLAARGLFTELKVAALDRPNRHWHTPAECPKGRPDFMFQLGAGEAAFLRSQSVILKTGRGRHSKYLPYAFTEQGVAMLSSVLNSSRA